MPLLCRKVQFELEMQKPSIKWMGVALRNFRSELAKEFILPYKDGIQSLRLPPIEYPSIQKEDWKLFVNKILSQELQVCCLLILLDLFVVSY